MQHTNIAIVYLGDFFFDARCINMALSLQKENAQISIICTYNQKFHTSKFQNIKFYNIQIQNRGIKKYWEFHSKVKQILSERDFDTIISGDLYSLSSCCLSNNNAKIIYDCREIYTQLSAHYYKPIHKIFWNCYEHYFLKYVDTVLVTAISDLKYLKIKFKNYKHLKWNVIYNYPYDYKLNMTISLKEKYNIPKDQYLVLYQGVIQKKRGIRQLLYVIQKSKNLIGVIIGSGNTTYYKNFAKQLKIIDKVIFINKINYLDLFNYTSACDVGWAVIQNFGISNKNALPNKLFEYSLMGLPVIASKLPNMKKIIIENNLGILVDDKNTEEHLKAINTLINNSSDYINREKIKNIFTWQAQHQLFINSIYE